IAVKTNAFAKQKMKPIGPGVNRPKGRGLRDGALAIRSQLICSSSVADFTEPFCPQRSLCHRPAHKNERPNFCSSLANRLNLIYHAAFSDARSRTSSPQDRPHPFSAHRCARNFLAPPAHSFRGLGKSTPRSGILASETENGVRWVR